MWWLGLTLGVQAWDPRVHTWEKEAVSAAIGEVKRAPVPSSFLGDVSQMDRFGDVDWAWFAGDFDARKYRYIGVAPARNDMGRYHVTGQELFRGYLMEQLPRISPWSAGPSSQDDLTVYLDIHYFRTTNLAVEYMVETMAVDPAGHIVWKTQDVSNRTGATEMVVSGVLTAALSAGGRGGPNLLATGVAVGLSAPWDHDRFQFIADMTLQAAEAVAFTVLEASNAQRKGKSFPSGPGEMLSVDRSLLVDQRKESFGPALQAQIAGWVATASDPEEGSEERRKRMRELGQVGALAALPVAMQIVANEEEYEDLREEAAWALGEIGHPDAVATLQNARGLDPFNVRSALIKIQTY